MARPKSAKPGGNGNGEKTAAEGVSEKMTTVAYDLDEGADLIQPSAGWHLAILSSLEISPNKAGTGENIVVGLELDDSDPDRPGMPWTYYVPLPSPDLTKDFQAWKEAGQPKAAAWDPDYLTKDGRHKFQAALARLRKLSTALGGPESGKFDPAQLGRAVGKQVKINITPEREGGVPTGRMTIGFDGIAPA